MKPGGVITALWLAGLAFTANSRISPTSPAPIDAQLDQFSARGMHSLASLEYRRAIGSFAEGAQAAKSAGKLSRAQRS